MDKRKKSLLIGLVLGDGHLNSNSGVALEIEHSAKQKFYLEYKNKLISELLNCKQCNIYYRKSKDCYKISKGHPYFRVLKKWIYDNKEKRFSTKLLNYLTPEAIAIWFMDDGTHGKEYYPNDKSRIRSHKFILYTFTNKEDTQNIIDFFKNKYDIKFYPIWRKMKDGSTKAYLQCRTKEGRKLSKLIRPYIIPGMEYKIMNENE